MSENYKFDLIVIGSGPGGYVAAIRASQLGMKVMIVEKDKVGGVCLNWGCIPTKALLRSSEIYSYLNNLSVYGLSAKNILANTNTIINRSRNIAKKLSKGVDYLLKKNKVHLVKGKAKIINKNNIEVEDKKDIANYSTKNIIIATGARAKNLPNITTNNENIWTYKDALMPKSIPQNMAIIGSGAIGMEFASFYGSLGSNVTIYEAMDKIAPIEDDEISYHLEKSLINKGIKINKGTKIKNIECISDNLKIDHQINDRIITQQFEKVLVAIGITGNVEDLGLENTRVKLKNNHIVVGDFGKTEEEGVYAIGDVTGSPWLAHKASHEGIICVEKIAGKENLSSLDINLIPSCIYSSPQVASIGITEKKAKEKNINVRVGKFPLSANGKALSMSEEDGFIKTVFSSDTGEILGAHLIGCEVTELINCFSLAMKLEATEEDIFQTIFSHPTLSEAIHESSLNAFSISLHI